MDKTQATEKLLKKIRELVIPNYSLQRHNTDSHINNLVREISALKLRVAALENKTKGAV